MLFNLSFSKSLTTQLRIIRALIVRETLTRYGRHNIGFLWLFIEPMILTLGVTVLWHYTFRHTTYNLSITAFAVTGYSTVQLWRNTAGRCLFAINPNRSLLYHANIKILDIFLARIALEIISATSALFLIVVIFNFFDLMEPPQDILILLSGWFLLAWFGGALGLLLGAASELSEFVERVWHPVSYLLFPLSGAMFLVDWLPSALQPYAVLVPMISCNELIRFGYFGEKMHAYYDIPNVIMVNMILTFFALSLCAFVAKRVEHE